MTPFDLCQPGDRVEVHCDGAFFEVLVESKNEGKHMIRGRIVRQLDDSPPPPEVMAFFAGEVTGILESDQDREDDDRWNLL